MRIYLLSRDSKPNVVRRLREAARERGHEARVLDPRGFALSLKAGAHELRYHSKVMKNPDAVIPLFTIAVGGFGAAVTRQLEQKGAYTLNPSRALLLSQDKLQSLQALSQNHLEIPWTVFVRDRAEIADAISALGAPVVIKVFDERGAQRAIPVESEKTAQAIVETFHSARQRVLIQKLPADVPRDEKRVLVLGGEVLAAVRRSDVHVGEVATEGPAKYVRSALTEAELEGAIRATRVLGLRLAEVTLWTGADEWCVIDVTPTPNLTLFERTAKDDFAATIITYIEEHAALPEVNDLKLRLSLGEGYSVSELVVDPRGALADKTLRQLALKDRDVMVLCVQRGGMTIPNPGPDVVLMPGDRLTCYGPRHELRELIPHRRPGRRRRKKIDDPGTVEGDSIIEPADIDGYGDDLDGPDTDRRTASTQA